MFKSKQKNLGSHQKLLKKTVFDDSLKTSTVSKTPRLYKITQSLLPTLFKGYKRTGLLTAWQRNKILAFAR